MKLKDILYIIKFTISHDVERISNNIVKLQETKYISKFVSNREEILIYLDFLFANKRQYFVM